MTWITPLSSTPNSYFVSWHDLACVRMLPLILLWWIAPKNQPSNLQRHAATLQTEKFRPLKALYQTFHFTTLKSHLLWDNPKIPKIDWLVASSTPNIPKCRAIVRSSRNQHRGAVAPKHRQRDQQNQPALLHELGAWSWNLGERNAIAMNTCSSLLPPFSTWSYEHTKNKLGNFIASPIFPLFNLGNDSLLSRKPWVGARKWCLDVNDLRWHDTCFHW